MTEQSMPYQEETEAALNLLEHVEALEVPTGPDGRAVMTTFQGVWIIEPDDKDSRSSLRMADAGTYWGLAVTARRRFAVYHAHVNDRWPAALDDYDTLAEALEAMPGDLAQDATAQLTGRRTLDI